MHCESWAQLRFVSVGPCSLQCSVRLHNQFWNSDLRPRPSQNNNVSFGTGPRLIRLFEKKDLQKASKFLKVKRPPPTFRNRNASKSRYLRLWVCPDFCWRWRWPLFLGTSSVASFLFSFKRSPPVPSQYGCLLVSGKRQQLRHGALSQWPHSNHPH